jgi:hypothetical protein
MNGVIEMLTEVDYPVSSDFSEGEKDSPRTKETQQKNACIG